MIMANEIMIELLMVFMRFVSWGGHVARERCYIGADGELHGDCM